MTSAPREQLPAHLYGRLDQLAAEVPELRRMLDRIYSWTEQARDVIREADQSGAYNDQDGRFLGDEYARIGFKPVCDLFNDVAEGYLGWERPDRNRGLQG